MKKPLFNMQILNQTPINDGYNYFTYPANSSNSSACAWGAAYLAITEKKAPQGIWNKIRFMYSFRIFFMLLHRQLSKQLSHYEQRLMTSPYSSRAAIKSDLIAWLYEHGYDKPEVPNPSNFSLKPEREATNA